MTTTTSRYLTDALPATDFSYPYAQALRGEILAQCGYFVPLSQAEKDRTRRLYRSSGRSFAPQLLVVRQKQTRLYSVLRTKFSMPSASFSRLSFASLSVIKSNPLPVISMAMSIPLSSEEARAAVRCDGETNSLLV